MINRDFNPKGYTSQILKDLTMVSELGDKKNIPLPMSNLTKQLFTILSEKSKENLDGTSIIKLFNKDDKF
jgi:3-hydroxyisobutyrate dehydrogenase-like beta-hydroxyacid dehydrogenase